MKKLINILLFAIIVFLASCGANSSEQVEIEIADSIRVADSIAYTSDTTKKINQPVETLLEREEKKIGEINHVIKDTMNYGISDTVEITISYNCPKNIIVDSVQTFRRYLRSQRNIVTQPIKVTPEMRARLIDPTGNSFKIIPITDTVQIIEMKDSTFTLWQWRVTPIKAGNQNLVLSVDMIVGNSKKSLKIYQDKIYIHIGYWTKIWNFIKLNWTYITYVIGGIFAILGWLYKEKIIKIFKS